ncbi:copper chaperone PCu(A)C [Phenylobacterium sp. J367]|uniref:copper chaperone PCu(A)C n=1 Tax=Phenylobacterium sp. J367 TaxID=2898435 RepID=UPI002150E75C|nr:copper chaperone PCu(A)C [Phenylobacterium sp. J367]MCR5877753.1 copper chaperone PCu(A)C [Phenylobacterium sp. J367]
MIATTLSTPALAQAGLTVTQAWSRPAAAGTTGAGFFALKNSGRVADALVAAESPVARKVEIHRSSMTGGVMRMSKLDRVPAPAGGEVLFAPGGYHLMLMGLTRALNPGDKVPLTLTFASGAKIKTELAVGSGQGAPARDHSHH